MASISASVDADALGVSRQPGDRRRLPLHVHIVTLFMLLILGVGGVITWHNYVENRQLVVSASQELIRVIGDKTVGALTSIYSPVELAIDLVARQRLGQAASLAERMDSVPMLADALEHSAALSALYAGYGNGDFFLLRPLRDNAVLRGQFKAPASAAWLVQSIEHDRQGAMRGTYLFLDSARRVLERREAPHYVYDPRLRVWYQQAVAASRQVRTDPYVFFTTGDVGVTFARPFDAGEGAVVGADLTLGDLSHILAQQKLTPSSQLVLFNADGMALAYDKPERMRLEGADRANPRLAKVTELGSPELVAMMAQFAPGPSTARVAIDLGGQAWEGSLSRLAVEGEPRGVYLAVLSPRDELLSEARRISRDTLLIAFAIMLASIPVAWLFSRLLTTPLRSLLRGARAVREFDFASQTSTRSIVAEVDELAITMDSMKVTIRNFLDIAATISAERSFKRLLDHILQETIAVSGSAAGVIYLFDDEQRSLEAAAAVRNAGSDPSPAPVPPVDASLTHHAVRRAAAERRTIVVPLDARHADLLPLLGTKRDPRSQSAGTAIAVPLSNRQAEILGVVCLLNASAENELPRELVSFVEALSGTAAIAIENQGLLQEQKALLDSFIKLVAGAIDAKSPYTGGHCQRVPELATMIARAACDAKQGPFRDFAMSDDEWETLHIAAWLHDCGKVTTPEYVVDKATKLQTIYDRLHEVRMRFEVLKRDAEIDFWRRVADGGDRQALRSELDTRLAELDADFRFVAQCNEGGETMAPESVERIKRVAARTWLRTLDDRVGLSHEERSRPTAAGASSLPAVEKLLADKPEHITVRGEVPIPPAHAGTFRVDVPPYKRNNGEIYNLCIGRGTLTEEERYVINDHVVQTIRMLTQLPFPKHLKQVPEIAGGHHERLDGTGYPRRLGSDELSPAARILAIADIFEALTARDRPYKTGRTLSQAVAIMSSMCAKRHIDAELFQLFLTAGVYRDYALRFLDPAQIDEVDIDAYVAKAAVH